MMAANAALEYHIRQNWLIANPGFMFLLEQVEKSLWLDDFCWPNSVFGQNIAVLLTLSFLGTCGVLLRKISGTAIIQLPSKRQIQVSPLEFRNISEDKRQGSFNTQNCLHGEEHHLCCFFHQCFPTSNASFGMCQHMQKRVRGLVW